VPDSGRRAAVETNSAFAAVIGGTRGASSRWPGYTLRTVELTLTRLQILSPEHGGAVFSAGIRLKRGGLRVCDRVWTTGFKADLQPPDGNSPENQTKDVVST
jgi:hypothetical protein